MHNIMIFQDHSIEDTIHYIFHISMLIDLDKIYPNNFLHTNYSLNKVILYIHDNLLDFLYRRCNYHYKFCIFYQFYLDNTQ